jgi:hypothetical protein
MKNWPVRDYWVRYDPATHCAKIWLSIENDPAPEVIKENLSAEDMAAIAVILLGGGARYFEDGSIGVESTITRKGNLRPVQRRAF